MVKSLKRGMILLGVVLASVFCALGFSPSKNFELDIKPIEQQVVGEDSSSTVTVLGDFEKGDVTGEGRYAVGDPVVLTATAKDGCYFVGWQIKVGETYSDVANTPTYSFVMDNSDVTYRAVFDYTQYTIATSFTDYFDLTNFDYTYDATRFGDDNIGEYPRADKDNAFGDGRVYYNDIVTMQFAIKDNVYLKKILSNYLSFNTKPIVLINLNVDGKITSMQIGRAETSFDASKTLDEMISAGDLTLDYDSYTYVVLTHKSVGANSITTNIELRYKVKNDATFNLSATELYLFTILAVDERNTTIEKSKTGELISFEYGYYGSIDNEEKIQYLMESGANYSFSFSSDKFFTYISACLSGDGIVGTEKNDINLRGYFNKSYNLLTVKFARKTYDVEFVEMVRVNGQNVESEISWYVIDSLSLYPNQKIVLDIESNSLIIDDGELNTIAPNTVYGYQLFAITTNKECEEESLTQLEVIVDPDDPDDIKVYIIYTKIEYTIHIDVLDKSGNSNLYLKSKINSLPADSQTVTTGQKINLTGIAYSGFEILGWKEFDALTDDNRSSLVSKLYLANTNFDFSPKSNDEVDLYYYLFVDYVYKTLNYQLFDTSWWTDEATTSAMASLSLGIVDSWTVDGTTLKVFGSTILGEDTTLNDEIFVTTLQDDRETDLGNGKIKYQYATPIGDVEILKTDDNFTSLTYASHTYLFDGEKFLKDTSVDRSFVNNYSYTVGEMYKYSISNITCDDVVLCFASNMDATVFAFNCFTITGSSTLPYLDLGSDKYAYVHSNFSDLNLQVIFSLRTQKIAVQIDGNGYSLSDVQVSGVDFEVGDFGINISAELGDTVGIAIQNDKIEKGYQFDKFTMNYEGSQTPTINGLEMSFVMISDYVGKIITIHIVAIEYTIQIVDDAGGLGVEYDPQSADGSTDISDSKTITLSWNKVLNPDGTHIVPILKMSSKEGFYISNAYINENVKDNVIEELIGDKNSQTIASISIEFEQFVLNNANQDNVVYLYIVQTERTYSVTFVYYLSNKDSAENTQKAKIKSSFDESVKSATPNGADFIVAFEDITFGSEVTFTMDDSAVGGIAFSYWASLQGNQLIRLSSDNAITVEIINAKNLTYYAVFECLNYSVEFNLKFKDVDGRETNTNENVGQAKSGEKEVKIINFQVGDIINFSVSANAGYKFDRLYYGYLLNVADSNFATHELSFIYSSTNGIDKIDETLDGVFYQIDVSSNLNDTGKFNSLLTFDIAGRWSTKDLQKNNADYRRMIVNLVFVERSYTVTTNTINLTEFNPTGVEVDDWIDQNSFSVTYCDTIDGDFVKLASGRYAIDNYIQITFKPSFGGIKLNNNICFVDNDDSFKLAFNLNNKDTNYNVANQSMNFKLQDGLYVLIFKLNTTLLEALGQGENLDVYLRFQVKEFTINFSATNYKGLIEHYGLELVYQEVTGGNKSPNTYDFVTTAYYGDNLQCVVNLNVATNNFSQKYYFSYFLLGSNKLGIRESKEEPAQYYTLNLCDMDGENIWQTILQNWDDQEIVVIQAYFQPRITLNNFEFKTGDETSYYLRSTVYNGENQSLKDGDVTYDADEFAITITYYRVNDIFDKTGDSNIAEPIDAGKYNITLSIGQIYTFPYKVILIINRKSVTLNYVGDAVSKVYDGKSTVTKNNIEYLSGNFNLDGVVDRDKDYAPFNFNNMTGVFATNNIEDKSVAVDKDIILYNIGLSDSLKNNYEFATHLEDTYYLTNIVLEKKGEITALSVSINKGLFTFFNIVYKDATDYKLKYDTHTDLEIGGQKVVKINKDGKIERILVSNAVEGDEVYVSFDGTISSLTMSLEDYSIGKNKKVVVGGNTALVGADSGNYKLEELTYLIDIYPYKLTYVVENVGEFEIVDLDEKGLISFDVYDNAEFKVKYIDSTSPDYPRLYSILEDNVSRDEKIHSFYIFSLTTQNGASVDIAKKLKGCYIRIPYVQDIMAVYAISGQDAESTGYAIANSKIQMKISDNTKSTFGIVVDKSYFAVWKIVLIVGLSLLLLLIIIVIILIISRKRQRETDEKHKI